MSIYTSLPYTYIFAFRNRSAIDRLQNHASSEKLVSGDPDGGLRRGLDVDEVEALPRVQRRHPLGRHVPVPGLVEAPQPAFELQDAEVELPHRLPGPVGHRGRVPVVLRRGVPPPPRPRPGHVLLDLERRPRGVAAPVAVRYRPRGVL
jgi:hypothetical protein